MHVVLADVQTGTHSLTHGTSIYVQRYPSDAFFAYDISTIYHILINMFERSEIASEPKWLPGLQFSAAFEETQVELTDSGTQVAQRNAA